MQVSNPLVPPTTGQPGGAAAPVANAPAAAETGKSESAQPVTAAKESERGRNESQRSPEPSQQESQPGQQVDIQV